MFWLTFAFQLVSGLPTLDKDREAFEPYKQCVIEQARIYASTSENVQNISDASLSDCRDKKAMALLNILDNSLTVELSTKNTTGTIVKGSNENIEQFEKMLRQDIAATVLKERLTHAK